MKTARLGRLSAGCLMGILAHGTALAASQGTLGTTSTGSISIGASVPNRVQISNLADVSFTNQDPSVAASNAQNVCVWSNSSTKGYNITATGSGAANAFTLSNGKAYVEAALTKGLDINVFGKRLSFFFNAHNNLFEEVAKFRAARRMWAQMMKDH